MLYERIRNGTCNIFEKFSNGVCMFHILKSPQQFIDLTECMNETMRHSHIGENKLQSFVVNKS